MESRWKCYILDDCLFQCPNFLVERKTPLNKVINSGSDILNQIDATVTKTFLFSILNKKNHPPLIFATLIFEIETENIPKLK